MKRAYVTLLSSENYLDAVAVLALSLQLVESKYPLVVAITEDIYTAEIRKLLKALKCKIEVIEPLKYSNQVIKKNVNKSVLNTASKIQIFDFTYWDKLVYLDADSIVLQNIDDLFDRLDGSILWDPEEDDQGFTGLFVFEPRKHEETKFYNTLMLNSDCFDGDLIGKLWFYVKSNPDYQINYNYFTQYSPKEQLDHNVKAYHFCNHPKPWLEPDYEDFSDKYPIGKIYRAYLNEIKNIKNNL